MSGWMSVPCDGLASNSGCIPDQDRLWIHYEPDHVKTFTEMIESPNNTRKSTTITHWVWTHCYVSGYVWNHALFMFGLLPLFLFTSMCQSCLNPFCLPMRVVFEHHFFTIRTCGLSAAVPAPHHPASILNNSQPCSLICHLFNNASGLTSAFCCNKAKGIKNQLFHHLLPFEYSCPRVPFCLFLFCKTMNAAPYTVIALSSFRLLFCLVLKCQGKKHTDPSLELLSFV